MDLTQEQYLGSRNIQRIILKRTKTIAGNLTSNPESPDDSDDKAIDLVVADFLISDSFLELLLQEDRLPEITADIRINR
jgi:hypothetical protein